MGEVVHAAATPLVWQGCEYRWVGYDEGVHSQETGGSGDGCGGIFDDKSATRRSNVCHLTPTSEAQLPQQTRERPAVRGASCVWIVPIYRRCWTLSPGITLLWRWLILKIAPPTFDVMCMFPPPRVFQIMLVVFWTQSAFLYQKAKGSSCFFR